jgi:protein-L-isoaspartate(D-aspartate) O-methyltransferase
MRVSRNTVVIIALAAIAAAIGARCGQERFEDARERMVREQIVPRGVLHTETLRALRKVPRHEFVPPELAHRAHDDTPLPIGHGQTISQPYIVALMTQLIMPHSGQRVLEVGTGSGYQAAVLAEIVDSVFTIEIVPGLARSSAERLRHMNYTNIVVREGDGYLGWPDHAPFDAILVTAAAEEIPKPLIDQLAEGGVMVIPVGPAESLQYLMLVRKQGGLPATQTLIPVRFVPLVRP